MRKLLRQYLEIRVSLDQPELVFSRLSRLEALAAIRRLGTSSAAPAANPDSVRQEEPPSCTSIELETGGGGREEISRLASTGTGEEIRRLPNLDVLRTVAHECTRCGLHASRKHVVFGEGDAQARVICVGEAPGAVEDETGRPFVGRAGQLLDRLLLSVGFGRESVYICNVLKCRPPGNRDPRPDEVQACSPYLLRQLELITPEVIVAFGTFAARTLLGTRESLGRLRGRTHLYEGYPVVVTYHPAALLRNPGWTRPTWEDLQRVRNLALEGRERGMREVGSGQGGLFG